MLGNGTQISPYIIENEADLRNIVNLSRGQGTYYELGNDIIMSSTPFIPISSFYGNFDGKGHVIENLYVYESSNYGGLFGYSVYANYSNIGLRNVYVSTNGQSIGGLVGELYQGSIKNCWVTGTVEGRNSNVNNRFVGGLVGLFNANDKQGLNIENCYTMTTIRGYSYVGGIAGYLYSGKIINSFASGRLTVNDPYTVGGISCGTQSDVINSYYNSAYGTYNKSVSTGIALSYSQFGVQSNFNSWDFNSIWYIDKEFPNLKVFYRITKQIAKFELVSSMDKITASAVNRKKKLHQLNSNVSKINASDSVVRRSKRTGNVFVSPFETSVQKTSRSVRSGRSNVLGLVSPISTTVERKTRTIRKLFTHVESMYTSNYVFVPIRNDVIIAHAYYIENPSSTTKCENISLLNVIENPSNMEVIE